jgi:rRNA maturation endonuclease Nob1
MRLFRRRNDEVEPERCPLCRERVPEHADECAMCGADLRTLRPRSPRGPREPVERS